MSEVKSVKAKIVEVIGEMQTVPRNLAEEDYDKPLSDLGADSLDMVELVMALEEAFEIEIPDEDAESLHSVNDLEAYIAKRKA